jgi:hypothetical protein
VAKSGSVAGSGVAGEAGVRLPPVAKRKSVEVEARVAFKKVRPT